jgi:hypothetical protein
VQTGVGLRRLSILGVLCVVFAALAVYQAVPGRAATGHYSPPEWFPLHRDVDGAEIKVGCTYLSYGTQGGYECGGHHDYWALDLIASTGTSIFPAGAGLARNVTGQSGYSGYGNVVVVDHGGNVKSLYAHMSQVLVSGAGTWVDTNTVIGKVGTSGTTSVSHVHFEASSSGRFGIGSRDPGPLKACHGAMLLAYPQAWGLSTWKGIAWGAHAGYSDGTGCVSASAPSPVVGGVLPASPGAAAGPGAGAAAGGGAAAGPGSGAGAAAGPAGTLLQVERAAGAASWQRYPIRPDAAISGAPGVVWDAVGVAVFGAGPDGALRQFSSGSTGWTSVSVMPAGTLSASGGVSAVRVGAKLEVFAVGKDATLLQVEQTAAGTPWKRSEIRPDAKIVGAPSVVWNSSGASVFAAGQDGALRQFSLSAGPNGSAGSWSVSVVTPAGTLSSLGGVSAVRVGAKSEVFAVGNDGTLLQEERATAVSTWQRFDIRPEVKIVGAPSVVWNATGLSVFAAGPDGALQQFSFSRAGSAAGAASAGSWATSVVAPAGTLSARGGVSAVRAGAKSEIFAVTAR